MDMKSIRIYTSLFLVSDFLRNMNLLFPLG